MKNLTYILLSLIFGIIGQLFLKAGMNKIGKINLLNKKVIKILFKIFTQTYIIIGCVFFGISMILWVVVLSNFDLSFAYPLVSISYVFIALLSRLLFKEKVSLRRWISIGLIVFGVFLVGFSL